jgi:hypothetical protein
MQNPGKWGGRAILLVNLEENQRLTSRCECKLTQGSWEAWWGWRSSSLAARPKAKAKAAATPPPPSPVAVAPHPKAKAVPKAVGKPRDQPFPALSYRREPPGVRNPLVATVQCLFNATDPKRPIGNIGRSIGDVKRRGGTSMEIGRMEGSALMSCSKHLVAVDCGQGLDVLSGSRHKG